MRRYQLIPSHAVQTLLITSVSPLPSGEIGAPYSFTFNAIGGVAPYTWSEVGAIPSGLTFSGGTLSGTPTGTFSSSFNVTVTDNVGSQFTRAFSLTVITAVQISTASPLPGGTVGVAYSTTIAATGGATPYSWSILGFTGANSYSINSVTGMLTGTLGVAEIDSINIQVVDALGIPSAKNFNLTVIPAASLTITTTSPLPAATQSSAYSTTMAATGGTPPYTWSLTSHTGTNTWSVSSGGVVTGTPGTIETDSLVIKVTDSVLATATGTFSLTVNAPVAFDFFIAPNGDDTLGDGSLGNPWSITAFNSKSATYSGKRVGLIGDIAGTQTPYTHGTINGVQTTLLSISNGNGNQPTINTNGGTIAASTYIASCDSSGVYKARWAILDFGSPTNAVNTCFGYSSNTATQVPKPGFITFDGITIRNFTYCGLSAQNTGGSALPNVVIENCELYNGLCPNTSNNPGAVIVTLTQGVVLNNNKIHDLSTTAAQWGFAAFRTYGNVADSSMGIICTNNTTYNCTAWLTKDGFSDFGNCSYNYFDFGVFGSGNNNYTLIGQGVVTGHSPGTGVTSNFHHNICLGAMQVKTQTGGNTITGTLNCSNNTFYGTANAVPFDALFCLNGTGTPGIQFQHNIVYAIGSTAYDHATNGGCVYVDAEFAIANATFNNNVYGSNGNGCAWSRAGEDQGLSFSTWKSTYSVDSTSVQVASSPFSGTPTALTPSTFAVNASAIIGGVTCGALDGSGPIGCNF